MNEETYLDQLAQQLPQEKSSHLSIYDKQELARKLNKSKIPIGKLIVTNVVSDFTIGSKIDCFALVETLHGRLNNQVFPAIVSVCREVRTTNNGFSSGKTLVSGAKDDFQSLWSAHIYVARLSRDLNRPDFQMQDFTIRNIVSSCYVGFCIDVHRFAEENAEKVGFDENVFAGAHWTASKKYKISFIVFDTGKVLLIGSKKFSQIKESEKFLRYLEKYKLNTIIAPTRQARRLKFHKAEISEKLLKQQLLHEVRTYNPHIFFNNLLKECHKKLIPFDLG